MKILGYMFMYGLGMTIVFAFLGLYSEKERTICILIQILLMIIYGLILFFKEKKRKDND